MVGSPRACALVLVMAGLSCLGGCKDKVKQRYTEVAPALRAPIEEVQRCSDKLHAAFDSKHKDRAQMFASMAEVRFVMTACSAAATALESALPPAAGGEEALVLARLRTACADARAACENAGSLLEGGKRTMDCSGKMGTLFGTIDGLSKHARDKGVSIPGIATELRGAGAKPAGS